MKSIIVLLVQTLNDISDIVLIMNIDLLPNASDIGVLPADTFKLLEKQERLLLELLDASNQLIQLFAIGLRQDQLE